MEKKNNNNNSSRENTTKLFNSLLLLLLETCKVALQGSEIGASACVHVFVRAPMSVYAHVLVEVRGQC